MTSTSSGELAFVWAPGRRGKSVWFSPSGTSYIPKYGARQTLVRDGNTWRVTDPNGTVWEFSVIDELITKQISPGGQLTEYFRQNGVIVEKRRTVENDVESRIFQYSAGNVSEVTLYRGTSTQPHQTAVRKVALTYYQANETGKGNAGSLKTVTVMVPQGTGWQGIGTSYYRYYTSDGPVGFRDGLKYVIGPSGYAGLTNPQNATDQQLAAVADRYYQYEPTTRRVTHSAIQGGSRTYDITYTRSNNSQDYNHWQLKAVATMPGNWTKTVFSNHVSQDLLIDDQQGTDRWIRYNHFNTGGRIDRQYSPSAIDMSGTPYNEHSANLSVQVNANKGLIRVRTYYGGGAIAPGYLRKQQVKRGAAGSVANGGLVTLNETQYAKHVINNGTPTQTTVFPVSKRIVYRCEDSGGTDPVETSYTNEFYAGTVQLRRVIEYLPNIGSLENGGGWLTGNTREQHFNIEGQTVKDIDARGTLTEFQYDPSNGAMSQMVQDPSGLNLGWNYLSDEMGRTIQSTGPAHVIDGQTVRTVQWTVYLDNEHEVRRASGYLIGSSNYTLVNPVSITRIDESGRVIDEIQAVRGTGVENSGPLTAADSFPQAIWSRWTHNEYAEDGLLQFTRTYFDIPDTGVGSSGVNYNQTDFGYDALNRQNYVKSPAGTITRTVRDARGLVLSSWVGTNDNGATDSDPSGAGASGNNMKPVTINIYDENAYGVNEDSLDGLLTKVILPVDDNPANDRSAEYRYDWRDRQTTTIDWDGTNQFEAINTLDNLDRIVMSEQYRIGSSNVLIAKSEALFDDRGQNYRTKTYAVDGSGMAGVALVNNTWFDQEGNVLKSLAAGSQLFSKTVYDNIGRSVAAYQGYYDGSGMDNPLSLVDNIIFTQTETTYDEVSSAIFAVSRQRWHDAVGTGELAGPATSPKSRDTFLANWYDGIGRSVATADYGTNDNNGPPSRPASPPASSSAALVSRTVFNPSGEVLDSIDPTEKIVRTTYDDLGRATAVVQNYGSTPTQELLTTYTADGQIKTYTAVNSDTGNQVTTYSYGVALGDSLLATNDLLASVTYPDNGVVEYEYNRQSEQILLSDPRGTIHTYIYDKMERQIADVVSTLGNGVDGGVRRITTSFDNRQRISHITSYDSITGGNITSDLEYRYNDFDLPIVEYQQHGGAVNTSTSPKILYGYADGSQNTVRRTSCTYPDGRVVNFVYGSGHDDKLSRVSTIQIGATDIVTYDYLGLSQVVIQTYVGPSSEVVYTLATGSGTNPYAGLDRFGRVIDLLWEQP